MTLKPGQAALSRCPIHLVPLRFKKTTASQPPMNVFRCPRCGYYEMYLFVS